MPDRCADILPILWGLQYSLRKITWRDYRYSNHSSRSKLVVEQTHPKVKVIVVTWRWFWLPEGDGGYLKVTMVN